MELQEKDRKHTGKLVRKSPKDKMCQLILITISIIGQMKGFSRKRIPEYTYGRKETFLQRSS